MDTTQAAYIWVNLGYNVVPQKAVAQKRPAVRWTALQKRRVTRDELSRWRPLFENGVGFITGEISNVIVIETDGLAGQTVLDEFQAKYGPLPPTLVIRSGSGRGFHYHFRHPGFRVRTVANSEIKLDIKGDGGFCVLPPSLHKSGGCYEIVHDAEPADLPVGLLDFIALRAREAKARNDRSRESSPTVLKAPQANHRNWPPVPLNSTNAAIVQSALSALPDEYPDDYDLWRNVGFALHDFDPGKVGLALWRKFSERRRDKAELTDFEAVWATFKRPYDGRKLTLGWLLGEARAQGWRAPCRWDHSTMILHDDDGE